MTNLMKHALDSTKNKWDNLVGEFYVTFYIK